MLSSAYLMDYNVASNAVVLETLDTASRRRVLSSTSVLCVATVGLYRGRPITLALESRAYVRIRPTARTTVKSTRVETYQTAHFQRHI